MPSIVFPTSSNPGLRPQESSGRLINGFVEKTELGAPGQTLWRRSVGLYYAADDGGISEHTRGFLPYDEAGDPVAPPPLPPGRRQGWSTAFWALNHTLNVINRNPDTGSYVIFDIIGSEGTNIGALPGTGPVTMARNNHFPRREAVAVADDRCWVLATGVLGIITPFPYGEESFPPGPTSVCSHDGYFIWSYRDGKIQASGLNTLELAADSFNIEQGQSVLRVVSFSGRLYAFGDKWTGVYKDAGAVPFPFLREVTIPRGILNTHAVAGWEPGWANELIWVGDDFIVYKLNGYTPVPISNEAVSRSIQQTVLARGQQRIEAFVYMYGKNAFWVLTSTEASGEGANWTWEYNATTGQWNERQSMAPAFPTPPVQLPNWRGHRSIRAGDEWLVGDQYTGNLYKIPENFYSEWLGTDSAPHVWTIESGVMSGFPMRTVIPRASFNITAGVGRILSGQGESGLLPGDPPGGFPNPVVKISWSLDGGANWGVPVLRSLGAAGDQRYYPSVISSGLSRGQGIRYRLVVEDAVHVGLSGGEIEVQPRAPI